MERGLEKIYGVEATGMFLSKMQSVYNDATKLVSSIGDFLGWMREHSDNEVYSHVCNTVFIRLKEEMIKQEVSLSEVLSSPEKAKEDLDRDFKLICEILDELKAEYVD